MSDSSAPQPDLLYAELTERIRQTAFEIHRYFGNGFLEKVYEGALENRLQKQGISVHRQAPLRVKDEDGTTVGHYTADLIIAGRVLIEIKATGNLVPEHQAQLLNYLKTTGIKVGLIINFGNRKLQLKRMAL
ncbi:GxxExxY protein [Wenzhouxiangella sp. EGI_FJ10409]|uniref:GxxExxY protein n=1 Tax=Wenzhouxiangella sp. EGI_FJ10409 TaxID=3243767 RepID=UPI0035DA3F70